MKVYNVNSYNVNKLSFAALKPGAPEDYVNAVRKITAWGANYKTWTGFQKSLEEAPNPIPEDVKGLSEVARAHLNFLGIDWSTHVDPQNVKREFPL